MFVHANDKGAHIILLYTQYTCVYHFYHDSHNLYSHHPEAQYVGAYLTMPYLFTI